MKTFSAALIAATVASAAAAPLTESQYQFLFTRFTEKYEKAYETTQFMAKYNTFKSNLRLVMDHNEKGSSYTLGMNQFGDMTTEEFSKYLNSHLALNNKVFGAASPAAPVKSIETTLDWTEKIRNPVKNQLSCGSCWAFSTLGAVEYRYAISRGENVAHRFSEQQLVDCDRSNSGCHGGLMETAFDYISKAGGVCLGSIYAYTGRDDFCRVAQCPQLYAKPKSAFAISGGEAGLVKELDNGPVTVAVAASASAFQFYRSGVLDDQSCGTDLNHAVLAVGYGPAEDGQKAYIKIRNSWGTGWGDEGYIRFAYGENICGLGSSISGGYDYVPVY